jgi:hypothetical protein
VASSTLTSQQHFGVIFLFSQVLSHTLGRCLLLWHLNDALGFSVRVHTPLCYMLKVESGLHTDSQKEGCKSIQVQPTLHSSLPVVKHDCFIANATLSSKFIVMSVTMETPQHLVQPL